MDAQGDRERPPADERHADRKLTAAPHLGAVLAELAALDGSAFADAVDDLVRAYERRYARHRDSARIHGTLRTQLRTTPESMVAASEDLHDLDALLRLVEIRADAARGESWREQLEASRRRLTSREVAALADADGRTVRLRTLAIRVRRVRDLLASVVKALAAKSWHLQSLARMEVAGIEDVILSDYDPLAGTDRMEDLP